MTNWDILKGRHQILQEKLKPEIYLNITGWNGNHKIFEDIIHTYQPKIIVEIGSYKGQSTITMADAIRDEKLDTVIFAIDTFTGSLEHWLNVTDRAITQGWLYDQFCTNVFLSGHKDRIYPLKMTSDTGVRYLIAHGIKADIIYIDGSHEYFDVRRDLINSMRLLAEDGVIIGDDYYIRNIHDGMKDTVKMAVDSVMKEKEHRYVMSIIDNNFYVISRFKI